ncbi:8378_t:CDS:2 [Paraglomus occultum]|uniref:Nitrogen permease regulator 3 n=1 Tax=Paraglomus occultum TaxID=144539 RepID=A0A9N8ZTD2_9GLOM|nr:8378_t:CDS:2 [Paraglomus occultum]
MEDICKRLDSVLIEYFDLIAEYQEQWSQICKELETGFITLAHAKYTMGPINISRYKYDARMKAISRVVMSQTIAGDSEGTTHYEYRLANHLHNQHDDGVKIGSEIEDHSETNSIRRRKTFAGETEDGGKGEAQDKRVRTNPLNWFGILVPISLREAQAHFERAESNEGAKGYRNQQRERQLNGGHGRFIFNYPKDPQRKHEIIDYTTGDEESDTETINENVPGDDTDKRSTLSRMELDTDDFDPTPSRRRVGGASRNDDGDEILLGFKKSYLADLLLPRSGSIKDFQLTIKKKDDDENVTDSQDIDQPAGAKVPSTTKPANRLTDFHLVFVLEPPELELIQHVDKMFKHVIAKITAALYYEQDRCDYVRQQADLIMQLKDAARLDKSADELMQITLKKSTLARTIADVYDAISIDSTAHALVNDYIDISLQIPSFSPDQDDNRQDLYEYTQFPVITPHKTLLLLEDPQDILKAMPLDANPTLVQLIQVITPTQSLNALTADFSQHCPNLDLITLLSELNTPAPSKLEDIIPTTFKEQKTIYFDAIAYLLRKDLIVQLHAYILVMVPPYVHMGCTRDEYERKLREGSYDHSKIISTPIAPPEQASDAERNWLNNITARRPEEIRSLFDR